VSRLVLRRADLAQIAEEARRALPREACGLLLGHGDVKAGFTVTRILESANVAPLEEAGRFEVDPALLLRTQRRLREAASASAAPERILGVYHSHPGGAPEPSATDRARAAEPGYVWLIVALAGAGGAAGAHAGKSGAGVEARAFLHAEGLEPARFAALALVLRDD
jgi:proteasome lid subunit RPN8/RPN11